MKRVGRYDVRRTMPARVPLLAVFLSLASYAPFASGARAQEAGAGMTEAELVVAVSSDGEEHGRTRVGPIHSGRLARGQTRTFAIRLEPGRCYVVAGRGGPGVQNLDVALVRGRTKVARDTDTEARALARYCAGEQPEALRLAVTAYRGAGLFAAALYLERPGATEARPTEVVGETALARLESVRARHAAGMRPVTAPMRETLAEGDRVERAIPLAPGRCYRVIAASEAGVRDLDLSVIGPGGVTLGRDASDDGTPTLGVIAPLCPATPGEHRLVLALEGGAGAFAWQVLGSGEERAAEAALSRYRVGGAIDSFLARAIRRRHGAVGEGMLPVTDLVSASLRAGERREHRFHARGGKCYVILGVGVPSIRNLDLEVRDQLGSSRGADTGPSATPMVRACAPVDGEWRVSIRVFEGYGQYGLQVFGD